MSGGVKAQFLASPLFENTGPPLEKLAPLRGSAGHEVTSVGAHLIVMGVAGCGKSAVGQRLAALLELPLIEGDDFHPASNVQKMQQGIALDDADRMGWLHTLGAELARHTHGAVLTCSALKASYRDALRAQVPGLGFVYLAITQAESLKRVAARAGHFYPPSLVASQFVALQDPSQEPGVLTLQGSNPLEELAERAANWVRGGALAAQPTA
jgi:gluconokinase